MPAGGPSSLFIGGLGYVGLRVAQAALRVGFDVSGTIRHDENAEQRRTQLQAMGIQAFTWNGDSLTIEPQALTALSDSTHLLSTIPPSRQLMKDTFLHTLRPTLIQASSLRWMGYLSSTSVYGNHDGDWVDEYSPTLGQDKSVMNRLDAEADWISLCEATNGRLRPRVFRLAGIYGPGRSAVDTVRRLHTFAGNDDERHLPLRGNCKTKMKGNYVSRCHVDDIVRVVMTSMMNDLQDDQNEEIYNVADNEPAPREDVLEYASALLYGPSLSSIAEIDFSEANMGERARRRATENKRVSNARMRRLISRTGGLQYPTYREGLLAILKDQVGDG